MAETATPRVRGQDVSTRRRQGPPPTASLEPSACRPDHRPHVHPGPLPDACFKGKKPEVQRGHGACQDLRERKWGDLNPGAGLESQWWPSGHAASLAGGQLLTRYHGPGAPVPSEGAAISPTAFRTLISRAAWRRSAVTHADFSSHTHLRNGTGRARGVQA